MVHNHYAKVSLIDTKFLHGQREASPAIAQLVEHLTVECCSNQMVPGSIPGRRNSHIDSGDPESNNLIIIHYHF